MLLEIGRVVADRYEITEKIGSGGMSIVYKAIDRKLNRPVSLKVLREEYSVDEEFRKRFIREARSVASLNHQNIVNVYDVGQDNDINYIVMEYIAGMTLKELIKKSAPFSDKESLGVAIQMAAALIHAHNSKIIHRDIKPQNVIVTGKGVIKVADFGIARKTDSNSATMGSSTTLGSVHYFSPEQAKGLKADPKSDLYSLGIVMFEMLTGRLPFDADTAVSVALMQINEQIPDITEYNPDSNPRVKRIVGKLTEKTPEHRYQSAEMLLKDLRALIANPNAVLSFEGEARVLPDASGDAEEPYDSRGYSFTPDIYPDDEDEPVVYEDDDAEADDYEDDSDVTPYVRGRHYDDYPDEDEKEPSELKRGRGTGRKVKGASDNRDRNIIIGGIITAVVLIGLFFAFAWNSLFKNLLTPKPTGTPTVMLPEMENRDYITVSRELESIGAKVNIVGEVYSSEVEEGQIIEASFSPGLVDIGTTVDVIISLGEEIIVVPAFTNNQSKDCYTQLSESGINLILDETLEYHPTYPSGMVYNQEPKANVRVAAGSTVMLYISKGQEFETFEIPKVVGKGIEAGSAELTGLGLNIGDVSYIFSDQYEKGVIMNQSLPPGRVANAGSTVHLIVSDGPEATPEPTIDPTTPAEIETTPEPTDSPTPTMPPGILPQNTQDPYPVINTQEPEPYIPPSTEPATESITEPTDSSQDVIFLPDATPVPTPEPTPPPQIPLMDEKKQGVLVIDDIKGLSLADVRVTYPENTGTSVAVVLIFEGRISKDDLPKHIPVAGNGTLQYRMYIHNGMEYEFYKDIYVNFDD